ncbi:alkaline phosphatase D family protein [Xanthomonas sp. 3307]|uniref:alkaline phosphatase D family protein n=1 Tax=Xanthomonas sp. 3307 TaxID=3035316 RepID=UPI00160888D8|nr:alkaline phosphatase D family protein [Xanthomonas sp. 3307]MBB5941090.1 alkaline phosphatase D [Xanthomonas sp. 3307]
MSTFNRRRFLALSGLSAFGAWMQTASALATQTDAKTLLPRNLLASPRFATTPFTLGVASGDPSPEGVVLWTRLAPEPLVYGGGMPTRPMVVDWEVAADEGFATLVRRGSSLAHPELGHALHVELKGLSPARPYWYRFRIGDHASPVGRTCTLPAATAKVERVRFAVAGCQHYEEGHYTAWRCIAEEPLDFVFHYGDYIYEGAARPGPRTMNGRPFTNLRDHVGPEIYTLDDYRRRYAQYKSDADLQAAHAAAPWFVTFDDHEVDNNWAGAEDQDDTPSEVFLLRRAQAFQAYYENMPLRRTAFPRDGHMQLYRRARYGTLMDLHLLDTRQYRSKQVDMTQRDQVQSPARSIMGEAQEQWLFDGLADKAPRWHTIAHQVALGNYAIEKNGEVVYSDDQWSGYLASRRRLLDHIQRVGFGNVVTTCGDAHRHFASDLVQDDADSGIVSSELLATSITSGSDGLGEDAVAENMLRHSPHLKASTDKRGYLLCDVRRDAWIGDMKTLDQVMQPNGTLQSWRRYAIAHGKPGLQEA